MERKKEEYSRSASLLRLDDCARKTVDRSRAFILIC